MENPDEQKQIKMADEKVSEIKSQLSGVLQH